MKEKKRLTIDQLAAQSKSGNTQDFKIMPDGEIRKLTKAEIKNKEKLITFRDDLGGEYAEAA